MLDGVLAVLAVELGHEPTPPEILARLAIMTGCYIGGAAKGHNDPEGFITKACQPVDRTARVVHRELSKQSS
jgi:hypothetical protein